MDAQEPKQGEIRAEWSDAAALDQVMVSELFLHMIRDHAYLTFGQIRLPVGDIEGKTAEIRPMARLVIPREALSRMLTVLNRANEENTK